MSTAPRAHAPLIQEDFKGLFARGTDDTVPEGYFIGAANIKFNEKTVLTRDGTELVHAATNIVRFFEYRRIGETPRFIYLNTSGQLYDSLFPETPIWADVAILDFSMAVMFNRAYITVHNRIEGLPNKFILVYTGSGTARLAGGGPPAGFTLVTADGASGKVEAGIHLVAVSYITNTGFITAPGTEAGISAHTAAGDFTIDVSAIPTGPAGTAQRIMLATKSIPASLYTGNKLGYEFFFVPNGTIEDNTATTKTIDFYDIDLVESADYLFDNLSTIPAGVSIITYNNRLVVVNEDGNNWTARVSEKGEPETFNDIDGFITVDPTESTGGLKNGFEHRKTLILTASNRIYATVDNDNAPSTWQVTVVDKSVGVECFGVATILDARGTGNDRVWIATRAGAVCFEGFVKKPELSDNIRDIWNRINNAEFERIQIVDDPITHRLIITVPIDEETNISNIIMGDYSKAFTVYNTIDERAVKWTWWGFPENPLSIIGSTDVTTGRPIFNFAFPDGIHVMKEGLTDDNGTAIDNYVQFNLKSSRSGWINHFGGLKFRIKGSGTLAVTMYGEDNILPTTGPIIELQAGPGKEFDIPINFKNEKMSVKIRLNEFGSYFVLNSFTVYAKPLWETRPSII